MGAVECGLERARQLPRIFKTQEYINAEILVLFLVCGCGGGRTKI